MRMIQTCITVVLLASGLVGCEERRAGLPEARSWLARCPENRGAMDGGQGERELYLWISEGRQIKELESAILGMCEKGQSDPIPTADICFGLGWIGTSQSIPYLTGVLLDKEMDVATRCEAVRAMALIGGPAAISSLAQFLKVQAGQEQEVSVLITSVTLAIIGIGTPEVIPLVEAELQKGHLSSRTAAFVRRQLRDLKAENLQGEKANEPEPVDNN